MEGRAARWGAAACGGRGGGAPSHARSVRRVADKADAAGLVRAEEDVRDELGHRGRGKVDAVAVVPGRLLADLVGDVDLEELHTSELEPALDEVALARRHEAGEERAGALARDNLADAADEPLVVFDGVKLNARLHHIDGRERAVRDAAAEAASERPRDEVLEAKRALAHDLPVALGGGRSEHTVAHLSSRRKK